MATGLTKYKKSVTKSNRKAGNISLGVSILTLSGFRICQMHSRQLAIASLTKHKSTS